MFLLFGLLLGMATEKGLTCYFWVIRATEKQIPPTPNSLFFGYYVDPLLPKEVFTMENQFFPKIP